ncbi:unnamed protein product [Ascophyllum nodosum]
MVDITSKKCRTKDCGKHPSFGVAGTKTMEYCAQHAPDGMVNVKNKKCKTKGCRRGPSFGVAGTKTVEYCAQHASDGMVGVCSIKCRSEGCDKQTSLGVACTKTVEYCALHAGPKCDVEGYTEEEVGPPHSGREIIGNITPNGAEHKIVHPPAITPPPSECSRGSRKRVHHSEITSTASKRAISRESAGGAGTMPDVDGQNSLVKRDNSVKIEVQLSF